MNINSHSFSSRSTVLIYNFHFADFHTPSQPACERPKHARTQNGWARSISDTSVAEPHKSLLTELLDPVLVPDLAISHKPQDKDQLSVGMNLTPTALLNVTHESNVDKLTTHVYRCWLIQDRPTLTRENTKFEIFPR